MTYCVTAAGAIGVVIFAFLMLLLGFLLGLMFTVGTGPMRTLVFVLAVLALAAVLGALGGLAVARDTVPSRTDARAYIVERFPRSAPRALLPDRQAWSFHTSSLWVQRARRCRRNERLVQVEVHVHGAAGAEPRGRRVRGDSVSGRGVGAAAGRSADWPSRRLRVRRMSEHWVCPNGHPFSSPVAVECECCDAQVACVRVGDVCTVSAAEELRSLIRDPVPVRALWRSRRRRSAAALGRGDS